MRPPNAEKVTEWMQALKPQLAPFYDRKLTRNDVADIIRLSFKNTMPKNKNLAKWEAWTAAMNSMVHLVGADVSSKVLVRNVHRLVANLHFIADGMAIPEWDGSKESSSVVFIGLIGVNDEVSTSERYVVKMKLKTGVCAGIITCAVLSHRTLAQFLLKTAGVSTLECSVEEVSGMEASLTLSLCDNGLVKVHEWSCNERQKKHNRDLAQRRRDVTKCGEAPLPCNACQKNITECPLAVWLPKKKEA